MKNAFFSSPQGGGEGRSWPEYLQVTYTKNVFDIERYQYLQEIAAEIIANHTNVEQSYLQDLFNQETGYATPKVDVRGAVFQNNKILLVKERSDGCWTLPGGWADIGKSPSESVVKEILEESGYYTRATKLIAVYDRDRQGHPPHPNYIYKLFFLKLIKSAHFICRQIKTSK